MELQTVSKGRASASKLDDGFNMVCWFMSLSISFQSYQDDGRVIINPSPAEPANNLLLQTVQIQISWLLFAI